MPKKKEEKARTAPTSARSRPKCEDCADKLPGYGLPSETSGGRNKRRWCSSCAQAHAGAVHVSTGKPPQKRQCSRLIICTRPDGHDEKCNGAAGDEAKMAKKKKSKGSTAAKPAKGKKAKAAAQAEPEAEPEAKPEACLRTENCTRPNRHPGGCRLKQGKPRSAARETPSKARAPTGGTSSAESAEPSPDRNSATGRPVQKRKQVDRAGDLVTLTDQPMAEGRTTEAPMCKKCTDQPQAPGKYVQCLMCQKIHTSLESMGHRFFGLVKAAPKKQHAAKKKAASKKQKDTFAPHGGRR